MSRTPPSQEGSRVLLADRLASFGALTAGLLHDLNNPLTYVVANLEFATDEITKALAHCRTRAEARGPGSETADLIPTVAEAVDALHEAQSGVEQVRALLRELRELARPMEEAPAQPTDVRAAIEWSVRMARRQVRDRARIEWTGGELPRAHASAAHLGHVFLDLLINAAESIPDDERDRDLIEVRAAPDADGRVIVEIRDRGCGISAEDRVRIFDPFYTTKPKTVGTGLGLSACREIVTGFGGTIELESEPGQGSTFRVVLPAARP